MGICAVYKYDLLRAMCVHIKMHAVPQTQFAIRGQFSKSDRATKIIVTCYSMKGFKNVKFVL